MDDHGARRQTPIGTRDGSGRRLLEAVIRACCVCEWEGEVIEVSGADPDCPWCHGPTQRNTTTSSDTAARGKNPHAVALGRLGGKKGGVARAQALSAVDRRRIASRAAKARWGKRPGKKGRMPR